MARRLVESENEYVEHVKNELLDLYKSLPVESKDIFPTSIRRCVEKFWEWKTIQDGIQSYYHTWVDKNVGDTNALQIIEKDIISLLQIAEENIATYTSYRQRLQKLQSYVKSWFEGPSQTSDAIIHEPRREIGQESREVALQRKVEELDKEYFLPSSISAVKSSLFKFLI